MVHVNADITMSEFQEGLTGPIQGCAEPLVMDFFHHIRLLRVLWDGKVRYEKRDIHRKYAP